MEKDSACLRLSGDMQIRAKVSESIRGVWGPSASGVDCLEDGAL